MKIAEVLKRMDELLPHNQYSVREEINWCDELGAKITQEIKKGYGVYELMPFEYGVIEDSENIPRQNERENASGRLRIDEGVLLPAHISFDMVESIRTPEGRTIEKVDFRSHDIWDNGRLRLPPGSVVIYLLRYQPIRNIEWEGTADVISDGVIMIEPPFITGDILDISINGREYKNVNVLDIVEHEERNDKYILILDWEDITEQTGAEVRIVRLITEETECPPPYDGMYINYVLANMAFNQQEYDRYNAQISMFNEKYQSYARWHKERNPLTSVDGFRNYW